MCRALCRKAKGHQFDSWSGHMMGGVRKEADGYFSLTWTFLFPPPPFSKNKSLLKKKELNRRWQETLLWIQRICPPIGRGLGHPGRCTKDKEKPLPHLQEDTQSRHVAGLRAECVGFLCSNPAVPYLTGEHLGGQGPAHPAMQPLRVTSQ